MIYDPTAHDAIVDDFAADEAEWDIHVHEALAMFHEPLPGPMTDVDLYAWSDEFTDDVLDEQIISWLVWAYCIGLGAVLGTLGWLVLVTA